MTYGMLALFASLVALVGVAGGFFIGLHTPSCWRIRHTDGRWRTIDSVGMPDFTDDEMEALCFTRRHLADAFATDDPEDVRIVHRQYHVIYGGPRQ